MQSDGKLTGTGASSGAELGYSVAISGDGRTAIAGGPYDQVQTGAAWVFTQTACDAWVPVASHRAALNQSVWMSDLALLNTGSVTANVQIKYYGEGYCATDTIHAAPGAKSILTDVVGQLFASGSGALELVSDLPLQISSRTYNQVSSGATCSPEGTQGQDYPAVAAGDGLAQGQSAFLGGLAEDASYRSNLGLVNTGSDSATVLVELFNGAGVKLAEYAVNLDPGQWAQETQPFKTKAARRRWTAATPGSRSSQERACSASPR